MILMPLGITETEENIEYRITNGYGVEDIIIIAPKGQEKEGFERAHELRHIIHQDKHKYLLNDGKIEVTLKASTPEKELAEILRFANVLNINRSIVSIDRSH